MKNPLKFQMLPSILVACNSCNQVVTRVQQLCYRADTTLLQLLQATKLLQLCVDALASTYHVVRACS